MKIKNIIPVFAIALGLVLAVATSAFKVDNPKNTTEFFWVLKSGTVASTNADDYERGSNACSNYIHFCGFYAPKDGAIDRPLIPMTGNLQNDLSDLNGDPDGHYNTSTKITFEDQE